MVWRTLTKRLKLRYVPTGTSLFMPFCSFLRNKDTRSGGLKALKLGLFLERAKGNPKKQGGKAVLRSKILTTRSADSIRETLRFPNPSVTTKLEYFIKV